MQQEDRIALIFVAVVLLLLLLALCPLGDARVSLFQSGEACVSLF